MSTWDASLKQSSVAKRIVAGITRASRWSLVALVRGYQMVISPMTGPTCRFYPSCSEYAIRAVRRHGIFRGGGIAFWRILRCNPWNYGGVDDVPGEGPRE